MKEWQKKKKRHGEIYYSTSLVEKPSVKVFIKFVTPKRQNRTI